MLKKQLSLILAPLALCWLASSAGAVTRSVVIEKVTPTEKPAVSEYGPEQDAHMVEAIRMGVEYVRTELPLRMDEDIELVDVAADGLQATYQYRTGHPAAHYLQGGFVAEQGARMRLMACSETFAKGLRLGARLRYAYVGSDGQPIASYTYDAAGCDLK